MNYLEEMLGQLKQTGDLERLISKVVVGRANPREINQIKRALLALVPVKALLKTQSNPTLKRLSEQLHPCELLVEKIEKELQESAPHAFASGRSN